MSIPSQPWKATPNKIAGPDDIGKLVVGYNVPYAYANELPSVCILTEYRPNYVLKYRTSDGKYHRTCVLWGSQ